MRESFHKYYVSLIKIKDFNVLIDNEPFFYQPVKTNKMRMKNLLKFQEMITIQQQTYYATNEITYNKDILKSNLCDYNDAYILVRGDFTVVASPATQVAFKNYAKFTKCIAKIDETTIDDAEDLDLVMLMYNLIEHSSNYSEA